jgi:hypothetical protein
MGIESSETVPGIIPHLVTSVSLTAGRQSSIVMPEGKGPPMIDTEFVDYNPKIADLPLTDRPRERLLRYGAAALSNAELLAVVLRVGGVGQNAVRLAEVLLARFGGLPGLSRAGAGELTQY